MFRLSIKTDNAAFEGKKLAEIARILREAANKIERGNPTANLLDYNGNLVGSFKLTNR